MMGVRVSQNIILVGFMGSGKSTVGRKLARRLGWRFRDTDSLVEQRAGMLISDIFAASGEAGFRELEAEVLSELSVTMEHTVLATGGGLILADANRLLLRDLGFVVWLTATPDALYERVSRNSQRPLLLTENPRATLERLVEARTPLYTEVADCVVNSTHLTHRATVDIIVSRAVQYYGRELIRLSKRRHVKKTDNVSGRGNNS